MISISGLSLLFVVLSAPAKESAGDAKYTSQDPSILSGNQHCPIQSQLKSVFI